MSNLIYKSRVKDLISDHGMLCDGDLPDAASDRLEAILEKAVKRAKANSRKTVRPEDL